MNDYWNDPPDEPEVPECCEQEMIVESNGDCRCEVCGKIIECKPEAIDEVFDDCTHSLEQIEASEECPHGKKWGDCDACDYASDLAFDAAREQRCFR